MSADTAPPQRLHKVKNLSLGTSERRLEAAVKHVCKRFIPVNPQVLHEIREQVQAGDFAQEREALIDQVKKDPALFLYCSRSAALIAQPEANPIAVLRRLDEHKLRSLFEVLPHQVSGHDLSSMNEEQAQSLQHSLVSSHAAEALAKETETVPSDLAFATTFFRHAGVNLIAWNYPKIYAEALSAQRRGRRDLDTEILEFIGVTPQQLAARLSTDWSIDPEIRRLITAPSTGTAGQIIAADAPGVQLLDVCRVAELYSRLRDPINYPSAEEQWARNAETIGRHLSLDTLARVEQQVEQALALYARECKAVLGLPMAGNYRDLHQHQEFAGDGWYLNPYVQKCPTAVRERFAEVYRTLHQARLSIEGVHVLINRAVPALGFKCGCLFLAQKPDMNLVPALRIGDFPLEAYVPLLRRYDIDIRSALHGLAPFKQEGRGVDGNQGTQVCGAFGDRAHPGVLYLELNEDIQTSPDHQTLLYFNALRQALIHCFGSKAGGGRE